MNQTELLYDLFSDPQEGMKNYLEYGKSFLFSLAIFLMGLLSQTISSLIINGSLSQGAVPIVVFGLFTKIFIYFLFWIFLASIYHFICSYKKYDGNILNLFLLLGVSFLPYLLLPSGAIISEVITPNNNFIYYIMYIITFIWSTRLQLQSMNIVYNIPISKSLWIFFTPFLIFIIFFMLLTTFFIVSIISLFL